jgi:hypothetical protein
MARLGGGAGQPPTTLRRVAGERVAVLDEPGREVPGGEHPLLAHVHQERKRSPLAVDRFD